MGTYFAIITARNSEKTINLAVQSVMDQDLKPEYAIVVDDGSSDDTYKILEELCKTYSNLYIIKHQDMGYDVTRIVKNWNEAISYAKKNKLPKTDYHLIATDDTIYNHDYAQKIIGFLDMHPRYAIISGEYNTGIKKVSRSSPHGAGRFVRQEFFDNTQWNGLYPEKMGYESAILYEGIFNGYKNFVLRYAKFAHVRPLGKDHKFYEFGASMKTLGYSKIFVLARFCKDFILGSGAGRRGSLNMIKSYIMFKPAKMGYYSLYPQEFRRKVSTIQRRKILYPFTLFCGAGKINR